MVFVLPWCTTDDDAAAACNYRYAQLRLTSPVCRIPPGSVKTAINTRPDVISTSAWYCTQYELGLLGGSSSCRLAQHRSSGLGREPAVWALSLAVDASGQLLPHRPHGPPCNTLLKRLATPWPSPGPPLFAFCTFSNVPSAFFFRYSSPRPCPWPCRCELAFSRWCRRPHRTPFVLGLVR